MHNFYSIPSSLTLTLSISLFILSGNYLLSMSKDGSWCFVDVPASACLRKVHSNATYIYLIQTHSSAIHVLLTFIVIIISPRFDELFHVLNFMYIFILFHFILFVVSYQDIVSFYCFPNCCEVIFPHRTLQYRTATPFPFPIASSSAYIHDTSHSLHLLVLSSLLSSPFDSSPFYQFFIPSALKRLKVRMSNYFAVRSSLIISCSTVSYRGEMDQSVYLSVCLMLIPAINTSSLHPSLALIALLSTFLFPFLSLPSP